MEFLLVCFNLTFVFFKAVSSRLLLKFIELCLSVCILISLIQIMPNPNVNISPVGPWYQSITSPSGECPFQR